MYIPAQVFPGLSDIPVLITKDLSVLIRIASEHMGVPDEMILSKNRKEEYITARHLCIVIFREVNRLTYQEVADKFNIHNSSIGYIRKTVRNRCETEPFLYNKLCAIISQFLQNTHQVEVDRIIKNITTYTPYERIADDF